MQYSSSKLAFVELVPGLKIEDVFKKVRAAVEAKTNGSQVPWESVSITDDFYFTGGAAISRENYGRSRPRPPENNTPAPAGAPPRTNPGESSGGATGPASRQQPKAKSAEANFFRFDLISCRASGSVIVCELTVTNKDTVDKEIMLRPGWDGGGTRAWDSSGNVYNADYPVLANSRERGVVTIGTSPKVRITFKGKGTGATKLSKIEVVFISGSTFSVAFRDICMVDDCGDSSMNSPSDGQARSYTASSAERSFTLPANQQWLDTGIDVEPGMRLELTASGKISHGQGRQAGPGGAPGIGAVNLFLPMRSAFMGALIAKIRYQNGKESKKVAVGARNTFVVGENESGRLFFGINDNSMNDNQGSFNVTVRW